MIIAAAGQADEVRADAQAGEIGHAQRDGQLDLDEHRGLPQPGQGDVGRPEAPNPALDLVAEPGGKLEQAVADALVVEGPQAGRIARRHAALGRRQLAGHDPQPLEIRGVELGPMPRDAEGEARDLRRVVAGFVARPLQEELQGDPRARGQHDRAQVDHGLRVLAAQDQGAEVEAQPNQWPGFTPPASAPSCRSIGLVCHRPAQPSHPAAHQALDDG
ncbi:MAG TPA: hypothetical protein VEG34_16175 [Thermoanaerobaculia bacterium]|nr:hypothetical protein [Thermoanaerobaculia bacterium]